MVTLAGKGQLETPAPPDEQAAAEWMTILSDVAVSDGQVNADEEQVLLDLGRHLDYSRADIKMLLAKRRAKRTRAPATG